MRGLPVYDKIFSSFNESPAEEQSEKTCHIVEKMIALSLSDDDNLFFFTTDSTLQTSAPAFQSHLQPQSVVCLAPQPSALDVQPMKHSALCKIMWVCSAACRRLSFCTKSAKRRRPPHRHQPLKTLCKHVVYRPFMKSKVKLGTHLIF